MSTATQNHSYVPWSTGSDVATGNRTSGWRPLEWWIVTWFLSFSLSKFKIWIQARTFNQLYRPGLAEWGVAIVKNLVSLARWISAGVCVTHMLPVPAVLNLVGRPVKYRAAALWPVWSLLRHRRQLLEGGQSFCCLTNRLGSAGRPKQALSGPRLGNEHGQRWRLARRAAI